MDADRLQQLQRENMVLRLQLEQLQRQLLAAQFPPAKHEPSDAPLSHPASPPATPLPLVGAAIDRALWQTATLETLFAALPDYIYVVERGTMAIPFCNDVFARGIGYPGRVAVEGRTIYECFPPERAAYFARQNEQVFTTGEVLHTVEQVALPDGIHHFDTYKVPIFGPDSQIIGLLGTSREITALVEARQALADLNAELEERIVSRTAELRATNQQLADKIAERARAEAALRMSEQRFRMVLDGSPITVFTQDQALRYTWLYNPAPGVSPEQLAFIGKTDVEIFGAEDGTRLMQVKSQVLESRVGLRSEVPVTIDGQVRSYDLRVEPLIDEADVLIGVMCISVDISERVAAEQALRASEMRYRLITDHSADLIMLLDLDAGGRILYASPSHERVLGYTPATGTIGAITVHPDDLHEAERVNRESVARGVAEGVVRVRAADGSYRWIEGQVTSFVQDGRRHAVSVGHDITERRKLEAQLFQAQKLEGIGRLAGGVAHDFNNLLTAISGYTGLARESLPVEHPLQTDLREIQGAADRATRLTRQLLTFARKQVTDPQILDLNTLITELRQLLHHLLRENIQLVEVLAPNLWPVRGDPSQLEQVIVNLAVNAQDAMPGGGSITIETSNMELDAAHASSCPPLQPGGYVLLTLTDSGVGMSETVLRQAFDPFFTTKPPGQGTGLGLSICYGIVTQHRGSIYLSSEVGRGTVAKVYLPQGVGRVAEPSPETQMAPPCGNETVLLVEDEPAVRALAARVLRGKGYTVLEAGSGVEALQVVASAGEAPIHLLLTDVVMPVMSGPALAVQLLTLRPGLKTLVMSGYISSVILEEHPLLAGTRLLQKPFTPLALAQAVRAALDAVEEPI
jgi:two-component system, cell cycle sensor histidine kinase and response regulator CckA